MAYRLFIQGKEIGVYRSFDDANFTALDFLAKEKKPKPEFWRQNGFKNIFYTAVFKHLKLKIIIRLEL